MSIIVVFPVCPLSYGCHHSKVVWKFVYNYTTNTLLTLQERNAMDGTSELFSPCLSHQAFYASRHTWAEIYNVNATDKDFTSQFLNISYQCASNLVI